MSTRISTLNTDVSCKRLWGDAPIGRALPAATEPPTRSDDPPRQVGRPRSARAVRSIGVGLVLGMCHAAAAQTLCPLPPPPEIHWCSNQQPTDCLSTTANETCLPRLVQIDSGIPTVLRCDCFALGDCGAVKITPTVIPEQFILSCDAVCPDPTEACQILIDGMPTGQSSVNSLNVPNGSIVTCQCVPLVPCQPDPTGLACTGDCPAGTVCTPTKVRRALDGTLLIIECECRTPGVCAIEIVPGAPEPRCVNDCPTTTEICILISAGTMDGTIDYTCECRDPNQPGFCAPILGTNTCGGPCPPGEACVPSVIVELSTGGFQVLECECRPLDRCRPIVDPLSGQVRCIGGCPAGETCELQTVPGPIGIEYRCECVPAQLGACCLADGTCTQTTPTNCMGMFIPNTPCGNTGACCIDADGDGIPEICRVMAEACCASVNGAFQGPNTVCLGVGACCFGIIGGACAEVDEVCCDEILGAFQGVGTTCSPNPCPGPVPCQPDPTGLACTGDCPAGTVCTPTKVRRALDGTLLIVECECRTPGVCAIEIVPGAPEPRCVNDCPTTTEICILISAGTMDGTIDYTCECRDPNQPGFCAPILGTNTCGGPCPPGEACVPSVIVELSTGGFQVLECECRPLDRCRPIVDPLSGQVRCIGGCPPGEICDPIVTPTPVGFEYRCDCAPLGACCLPDGTCVQTTQSNCPGVFTPNTPCGPIGACCIDADGDGIPETCNVMAEACCNLVGTFQGPNTPCVGIGACCIGSACVEVDRICCDDVMGTFQGLGTSCSPNPCPAGTPCQPDPSGLDCTGDCPAGTVCTPTKVLRELDGTLRVIECACLPPGECTIEIVPGALEPRCVNDCPDPTMVCTLFSSGRVDGSIEYSCRCRDPNIPGFCMPIAGANICGGFCPPGQACVPSVIVQPPLGGFQVLECECRPLDRCRPIVDSTGVVRCVGTCPPGERCELVSIQTANGIEHRCRCVPFGCVDPPPDMVAWWPLDETGGTQAAELINSNTGTHVGGPTPLLGMFVDNSLCFNGQGQYVNVPDDPALNFGTGDFSLDAWIRTTQTFGVQKIVDKRREAAVGVVGYSMFVSSGMLAFQIADGAGSALCASCPTGASCTNYGSGTVVATGQWVHVAVTVRRATNGGTFYVNGTPVGTFNPDCHPNSISNGNPLRIGSRSSSVTGLFNGCIDEVELFDRALTAVEVALIASARQEGKCRCDCPGDVNGDGDVNFADILGFVRCLLGIPQPGDNCACADLNGDGNTNGLDIPQFVDIIINGGGCCLPAPGAQSCNGPCPAPNVCIPVRIRWDSVTNEYTVLECRCGSPNECHVEIPLTPFGPPICVGGCPIAGEVCELVITPVGPNLADYECRCGPPQQVCRPDPTGQACDPVPCPDPLGIEQCVPTTIRRDLNGNFVIIECACLPPGECAEIALPLPGELEPRCVNDCPPGTPDICVLVTSANIDGSIDYTCECRDPNQPLFCGPAAATNQCRGACPPGEACVPIALLETSAGFQILACQCRPIDQCRPILDPAGVVRCIGACPPGQTCQITSVPTPSGIEHRCFCGP